MASEESLLHSTAMSVSDKHSRENVASVTVQMRFIPLKTDPEQRKSQEMATISVRVDDTQRGTPDNLLELKLPMISKLDSEGETFIQNKIKLNTTIFSPKGWTNADSLTKRLDKYAMFMTNQAKTDFIICQRRARREFLGHFLFKDPNRLLEITSKQDEFLSWLKESTNLTKLGLASRDSDVSKLESAFVKAVWRYERGIEYHAGIQLWKNHRHAFREHKKYFCNHLTKPFGMSIIKFNNQMKEYREFL